jgi:hypothetical protein
LKLQEQGKWCSKNYNISDDVDNSFDADVQTYVDTSSVLITIPVVTDWEALENIHNQMCGVVQNNKNCENINHPDECPRNAGEDAAIQS